MPGHVRIGGSWKTVSSPSVRVGGSWKSVSAGFTRVGGAWKQWYTATVPSAFDLLETQILGSNQGDVVFSNINSTYGANYQHLQLRMSHRGVTGGERSVVYIQLNGDTGTNYSRSVLFSSDPANSMGAAGNGSITYMDTPPVANAGNPSGVFSNSVVDFLDAFETTKNKTIRSIGGFMGTTSAFYYKLFMSNSARYNTEAITSIRIYSPDTIFLSGSRFSLYGIKAV